MPAKPRKIVSTRGGVAIVNHCAILNLLRVVHVLRRSLLVWQGPLGFTRKKPSWLELSFFV